MNEKYAKKGTLFSRQDALVRQLAESGQHSLREASSLLGGTYAGLRGYLLRNAIEWKYPSNRIVTHDRLSALVNQGLTRRQMAAELGVKFNAISKGLNRFNIRCPKESESRQRTPPELIVRNQEIYRMFETGLTKKAISQEFDISPERVRQIIKLRGNK